MNDLDADKFLYARNRSHRQVALQHVSRLQRVVDRHVKQADEIQNRPELDDVTKENVFRNHMAYRKTFLWALALAKDEVDRKGWSE